MWLFVERALEKAAQEGAFDHLPGSGTPIDLPEHPFVPPDWRLAFKILSDHRIAPEFVERRKAIEALRLEIGDLISDRGRDRSWRRLACRNRLQRLSEEVEALNQCLVRENQFVRGSFQLPPVDIEAELRTFDAAP
jgi:hypothetical protein